MKVNIMEADAERRAGLKTLVRRVMRQAQFTEVKDWQEAHATQKRSMPDMIVIDWASALRAIDLHALLEEAPDAPCAIVMDRPSAGDVFMLASAGATGVIPRALDPVMVSGHWKW